MSGGTRTLVREGEVNPCASGADLSRIFMEDMNELHQLSFLPTRDQKRLRLIL
jgi:hypothetical protein